MLKISNGCCKHPCILYICVFLSFHLSTVDIYTLVNPPGNIRRKGYYELQVMVSFKFKA